MIRDLWYNNLQKKFNYFLSHHFSEVRPMIQYVRENYNGGLVGVELGVRNGTNAKNILRILPNIKTLYLIDIWKDYSQDGVSYDHSDGYDKTKRNLSKYNGKILLIKGTLSEANIPDNFFDFMYVDSNHSREWVKKDLGGGYSKIKSGGVIGGHDFTGNHLGVIEAVLEFATKNDVELFTRHPDWWMVKS